MRRTLSFVGKTKGTEAWFLIWGKGRKYCRELFEFSSKLPLALLSLALRLSYFLFLIFLGFYFFLLWLIYIVLSISAEQQSDPVIYIYTYTYMHTHAHSFSHIILYYVPSQVIRYKNFFLLLFQGCTCGTWRFPGQGSNWSYR